jgi:hypothetical protein
MAFSDTSLVIKAVHAHRSGDKVGAVNLLEQSTSQIDELVRVEFYGCHRLLLKLRSAGRYVGYAVYHDMW